VKVHCSVLAEDAIKAAIADYKQKQSPRPARLRVRQLPRAVWQVSVVKRNDQITDVAATHIRKLMSSRASPKADCAWGSRRRLLRPQLYVQLERESRLGDE